jgi:hypothetical protein
MIVFEEKGDGLREGLKIFITLERPLEEGGRKLN